MRDYPVDSNYERNMLGVDTRPKQVNLNPPSDDSSLTSQLRRLHQLVSHLGQRVDKVSEVADKIDGPTPTVQGVAKQSEPMMNGIAGQVQIANGTLMELLVALEGHTARIDRHIG